MSKPVIFRPSSYPTSESINKAKKISFGTKYGLTKIDRDIALKRIESTKDFLSNNYLDIPNTKISLIEVFKNSYINPHRYIAEVNHRVYSLFDYSKQEGLENIFMTITLPSEYHPKKTLPNGKVIDNPKFIDDFEHSPKEATKELTRLFHKILKDRSYSKIPKEKRVYFRVTEPHKDGTPHLHISMFVPKENIEDIVIAFRRKFPSPQGKIEVNVENPVSYLMKYILKTLDDLRDTEKLSNLSLWYVRHKICRFYTSRTLISLDVYRALGGQFKLIELTKMYENDEIQIMLDTKTNKIHQINATECGTNIYTKYKVSLVDKNVDISFRTRYKNYLIKKASDIKNHLCNALVPIHNEKNQLTGYININTLQTYKELPYVSADSSKYRIYQHIEEIKEDLEFLNAFGKDDSYSVIVNNLKIFENELIKRGVLETNTLAFNIN